MKITTHNFIFERGDGRLLNDETVIRKLLSDIVGLAKLTPLNYSFHEFEPQGLSATLILAESHIAIHTWPEHGSGYVILTSCVSQPEKFIDTAAHCIREALKAELRIAKELA